MKKFLRSCALLAAVALIFSACKSHERCPAYGQLAKPNHHKEVRG